MARNVTARRRVLLIALLAALLAVLATSVSHGASRVAPSPGAASAKAWKKIIADAKKEGSVTIYTSQNPATMAVMAANFKAKYGIDVTINRQVDSVLVTQVTAEEGTHKPTADIWVAATKPYVLGAIKNGWIADAVGPDLYTKAYNRAANAGPGRAFAVGMAVLGMAWNTNLYPQGIKDIPDFLNPALTGKIGMPQPTSGSFIDWYYWLQDTYGKDIISKLAAQKPKIYLSSLTMQQAVESGEITASPFVPGTAVDDAKTKGAPIAFKLPNNGKSWNAPFWAMILKQAPHPAAAQLLSDYLVTPEGQAASMRLSGTILPNIPDTFYAPLHVQQLSRLTPAKITDFQNYWNSLFQH